jgi:hypothetical protein
MSNLADLDTLVFQEIITGSPASSSLPPNTTNNLLTNLPIERKKKHNGPLSIDKSRQCTAHARNGSGKRCNKAAVKGTNVCASHGGAAPQVKRAAKERLAELIEPALAGLNYALESNDLTAIVKAAQIVLDRTGFHPSQAIELTGKDGNPIQVQQATINVNDLPVEMREELLRVAKKSSLVGRE